MTRFLQLIGWRRDPAAVSPSESSRLRTGFAVLAGVVVLVLVMVLISKI